MAANVNKPTNIKQKEADINRKLQIYGIVSAFSHGKVPSVRLRPPPRAPPGARLTFAGRRTTRSMSPSTASCSRAR